MAEMRLTPVNMRAMYWIDLVFRIYNVINKYGKNTQHKIIRNN